MGSQAVVRLGIIGAGNISGQYLASLKRLPGLQLVAIADKFPDAAARAVAALEPPADVVALTPEQLLQRADVDVVLNLTIPAVHAEVSEAALRAGKHVYVEKPLALTFAEGSALVELAASLGLRLGTAPDTVLGTGIQTARAVVEAGQIGRPIAATAFMTTPGHELWHPNPDFYYQPGGGPLLDMGPYYLSALTHLLGPVDRVVAMTSRARDERTIGSGPRQGQDFAVEIDTHETALLHHVSGATTTLMMSFDVWAAELPPIEVYGTEGSLSVPDPNNFDGEVRLYTATSREWVVVPTSAGYPDSGRGYGLADLARGLGDGSAPRAGSDVALHVLEVIEAIGRSSREGVAVEVTTRPAIPAIVPAGAVPQEA